jgi:hypothetical protein
MLSTSKKVVLLFVLLLAMGCAKQLYYNWYQTRGLEFNPPLPTMADLRREFGERRDLNHKQTRQLYKDLLNGTIKDWVKTAREKGASVHDLAVGCTNVRWRVRIYTRSRDLEGSFMMDHALAVRDVYVHALTKKSPTALLDAPACLAMTEALPCPSYASLLAIKHSDEKVLEGCGRANPAYDRLANIMGDDDSPPIDVCSDDPDPAFCRSGEL